MVASSIQVQGSNATSGRFSLCCCGGCRLGAVRVGNGGVPADFDAAVVAEPDEEAVGTAPCWEELHAATASAAAAKIVMIGARRRRTLDKDPTFMHCPRAVLLRT